MTAAPEWLVAWAQGRGRGGRNDGSKGSLAVPDGGSKGSLAARALAALRQPEAALEDIAAAAEVMANHDIGWDAWNRIAMAFYAASGGREEGKECLRRWSSKSKKHRDEAVDERWHNFSRSPPTEIGYGALVFEARKEVPGWQPPVRGENTGHVNGVAALPPAFSEIRWPDKNKAGFPMATCRNARLAIRELGISCEHDTFHGKLRLGGQGIGEWAGDLTDDAVHMLRVAVEREYRFDPGTVAAHDAAVQECLQHGFDPVREYLDALKWDGVPRLDLWMTTYLGAEPTVLNGAIGRLALVAAVRRVRRPGYKFDQVVVLEGPEGRGKSSAIELLAGTDNFSDQTILSLDDRGQQEAVEGIWLYEIADLAGHSKTEVERIKAFASRTHDRARPAYGRLRVDRPRRCIFVATTNNDTYLKSQTGNRRFWPVRCGRIDLAALARDRDQLWAEAAWREASGMPLVLPGKLWGDAAEAQDSRREHDPWDDALGNIERVHAKTLFQSADGRGMEYRILSRDVMEMVLRLPMERQSDVTAKRVTFAMRRLKWDGPKTLRVGEHRGKGYTKDASG